MEMPIRPVFSDAVLVAAALLPEVADVPEHAVVAKSNVNAITIAKNFFMIKPPE